MPDIKIGEHVGTEWWPAAVENEQTADLTVTSTTAIPGTPVCEVSFQTPRTGRIGVCVAGNWTQASAGNRLFVTFEVYEGASAAGTLKRSARAHMGASGHGHTATALESGHGAMQMVEALTPNVNHYARIVFWTEGGTTNVLTHRRIIVFPMP